MKLSQFIKKLNQCANLTKGKDPDVFTMDGEWGWGKVQDVLISDGDAMLRENTTKGDILIS